MLSIPQRRFVEAQRVAHLATADRQAVPHVVPVCFGLLEESVYITIDEKPKGTRPLKRVRNIGENPRATMVFDRYDEDWRRLGWVMLQGGADILPSGAEHDRAQALLRERYRQLAVMQIAALPVIALRIERAVSWGNMAP